MLKILTLNLFIFLTGSVFGQSVEKIENSLSINDGQIENLKSISSHFQPSPEDVYLSKDWNYFKLITPEGEMYHFEGRLNITRSFVEAKIDNRIRKINNRKLGVLVNGTNRYILVKKEFLEESDRNIFMEILSIGDISLLNSIDIGFKRTRGTATLSPMVSGEEVKVIEQEYFVTQNFQSFQKFVARKSKIDELFGDKSDEIEKFIDLNNVKLRSTRDLVTVFNYYNTMP